MLRELETKGGLVTVEKLYIKLSVVVHAYNSSTWESEAGGLRV
jgi:hypothetical protein